MAVRQLSKELQLKAIAEINEDPKRTNDDLAYIKTWLSQQTYITPRSDDQILLSYLRGCKFSLERTKEKLDMYYTVKKLIPEVYDNRDPLAPDIQAVLNNGILLPLPKLADPAAPRITLVRVGHFNPAKIDFESIYKASGMLQDILVREDDNFVIAGCQVIHDVDKFGVAHLATVSPSLTKKVMVCFYQSYPVRVRGLYFINTSPVFEAVNNLFRAFLPDKVKARINVVASGNWSELHRTIPKSVLPEEYGGEGGKIADIAAHWKNKFESYREWFLEDSKYGTDEKKRPGKPQTSDIVFGVDGSFRKLAVD